MGKRTDDELDTALGRTLQDGRSDVGRAAGEETASEVAELVEVARAVQRDAPQAAPSPERRERALSQLHSDLALARSHRQDTTPTPLRGADGASPSRGPLRWFRSGWPAQIAAAVGALALISGAFIGASAAGADVSEPIRALFSSDSDVKASGVITELEPGLIVIDSGGELLTVLVPEEAEIRDANKEDSQFDALALGQPIELKGERQADGTIVAFRVSVTEAAPSAGDAGSQ